MTVRGEVDTWSGALSDATAALREQLAAVPTSDGLQPALIQRLRKSFSREEVEVAWHLTVARRKAAPKFDRADDMLCDIIGVEQSSGQAVAMRKARRFREAPGVVDLCCGIGGDTMALQEVVRAEDSSAVVRAVDLDPVRALMVTHNVAVLHGETVEAEVREVEGFAAGDAWIHIDPSRR
ncbi:MAG: hypothetical protein O7A71_06895, partial [Chloroflexi bacterium]|nr:hypothetical protein [Chloroflexota bacterium]